jgi:hypothetical protein
VFLIELRTEDLDPGPRGQSNAARRHLWSVLADCVVVLVHEPPGMVNTVSGPSRLDGHPQRVAGCWTHLTHVVAGQPDGGQT